MSHWEGLNRRRFPRVHYPCLVVARIIQDEPETLLTHTQNIGRGGVGILIRKNLRLFTPVELELDLMDLENHVRCHGRVVWSVRRKTDETKGPSFYDIGIEFSDLKEADLRRLEDTIFRVGRYERHSKNH
jgi:c-di-GMP-binding flagellar brake protein YcgR